MQVQTLPPDAIDPNPDQPRKRFTDLDELARSIHDRGLREPIMVRLIGERYQLIHGERR
jgi:ParB family chromosome partitioning protein